MKLLDLGSLESLPERDRLEAISLIGDGLDAGAPTGFGIAIGDRLYHIDDQQGTIAVRFANLLPIELGSIDRRLVVLPDDSEQWLAAAAEYAEFNARQRDAPEIPSLFPALRALKTSPVIHASVMIGRYGLAVLACEPEGWELSYRRFQSIGETVDGSGQQAPDLLDDGTGELSESEVELILSAHEQASVASAGSWPESRLVDIGAACYLALQCVERARITIHHAQDVQATLAATRNLIMPNR